jgi:thymidylate synthase
MTNDINTGVLNLLEEIFHYGKDSNPRGTTTREVRLAEITIDPTRAVMEFPSRPFNWKYFAGELAWYLSGKTDITLLQKFSKFWNNLTDEEGKVNSNYGSLLLQDHPSMEPWMQGIWAHGSQKDRFPNQLEWVYCSLVKDKHTRQAVAFLNSPFFQYEGNKDFVCTMYLNFWIDDDCLDMKVQMRSNDVFFGLTYDALWFSLVHQSMYLNLKKIYPSLKLGLYHHCADNIHYYDRHFTLVENLLKEKIEISPEFKIDVPLFIFDESELQYTVESARFMKHVIDKTEDKSFSSMTQEDWKNLIVDFFVKTSVTSTSI